MEVSMGIALYFIQFNGFSINHPFLDFLGTLMTMEPPKCWSSPRPICEARNPSDRTCMDSWQGTIELIRVLSVSLNAVWYISLYGFIMAYVGFYWIIGFYWFMLVSFILVCMFDIIHAKSLRVPRFFCFSLSRSKSRQHRPSWREIQVGLTRHFMPSSCLSTGFLGNWGYHIFRLIQGDPKLSSNLLVIKYQGLKDSNIFSNWYWADFGKDRTSQSCELIPDVDCFGEASDKMWRLARWGWDSAAIFVAYHSDAHLPLLLIPP